MTRTKYCRRLVTVIMMFTRKIMIVFMRQYLAFLTFNPVTLIIFPKKRE